jgi:hypothetical protein
MLRAIERRQAVRRAVQTDCHAVSSVDFRVLAQRVEDLSTAGMSITGEIPAQVGECLVVSFLTPPRRRASGVQTAQAVRHTSAEELWFGAEAVVVHAASRVSETLRGSLYTAGIEFTYFEKSARQLLSEYLDGYPRAQAGSAQMWPRRMASGLRVAMLSSESWVTNALRGVFN